MTVTKKVIFFYFYNIFRNILGSWEPSVVNIFYKFISAYKYSEER